MKTFELGHIVATPGAVEALRAAGQRAETLLRKHVRGDWGDVDEHDRAANDAALIDGGRLLSAYKTFNGVALWVVTEADRSSTCLLLPEEY